MAALMEGLVKLADCPIGLFECMGELCLKTAYGNNEGRIDSYIVSSGEFFWGPSPQSIANQRACMVRPVSLDRLAHSEPRPVAGEGIVLDAYDAGLLGDGGGGDVDWWQDYIRSELQRAHEFYSDQVAGGAA